MHVLLTGSVKPTFTLENIYLLLSLPGDFLLANLPPQVQQDDVSGTKSAWHAPDLDSGRADL